MDSCDFPATITICSTCSNITISRSRIRGRVEAAAGADLHGLRLADVEIDGTSTADDGQAAIGNNGYSCLRCDVHGSSRGANLGFGVTITDSWLHGWNPPAGAHVTGIGSNGGADNAVMHNNISCDILGDPSGYACSSALSLYGDDSWGNTRITITGNLLNSASSFCAIVAGPPAKTYPFTDVTFTGNVFGRAGADARGLPPAQCTEYGPIATQPASWGYAVGAEVGGNLWAGNMDSAGGAVLPD